MSHPFYDPLWLFDQWVDEEVLSPALARLVNLYEFGPVHFVRSFWGRREAQQRHRFMREDLRGQLLMAEEKHRALAQALNRAQARIAALEAELDHLSTAQPETEDASTYFQVGLHPEAPNVVVQAARRALLAHHHPDRWPEQKRLTAERQFKQIAGCFDKIAHLRAR